MKWVFALLLCLLVGPAVPAAPAPVAEVQAAIQAFFDDPLGPNANSHLRTVLQFAIASDQVQVQSDPVVNPWLSPAEKVDAAHSAPLMGAYMAGNVEAQLRVKKAADQPEAGLRRVFQVYEKMRKLEPSWLSPGIEKLQALDNQGKLSEHIRNGRQKLKNK